MSQRQKTYLVQPNLQLADYLSAVAVTTLHQTAKPGQQEALKQMPTLDQGRASERQHYNVPEHDLAAKHVPGG
jgi:hypothetical protein